MTEKPSMRCRSFGIAMATTFRFLASPEEAQTVLDWFARLREPPHVHPRPDGAALFFRQFGLLVMTATNEAGPKRSPVVLVLLPEVRHGILWTAGEVQFLPERMRSSFPGLQKVLTSFHGWLRTKTLAFACSALFLVGCASVSPSAEHPSQPSSFDSQAVRSLRWLDSADPQHDLNAALARGDTRFIGVYGYGPFTPGVERSVASRHGIRYLSGTSDAIQSHEHLRLNQLASSYAERYNKLLLQRLKQ